MGKDACVTRIVIVGGGPGGYEAALVAAQLGADVAVIEREGLGGACVLTDCVPSKTLISAAEVAVGHVDLVEVNARVRALAGAQSADIGTRLRREGVAIVEGSATVRSAGVVAVGGQELAADAILLAVGATPRVLPGMEPDGERILTWREVYGLSEVPERLVVVGSGVTGAEFASGYLGLGSHVTLVSSRERVLPGEDADAATVLEDVFARRGMTVLSRCRAQSVARTGDAVAVTLSDGRVVTGSHCLMAVGSIPNTSEMGLEEAGVNLDKGGFITVDKVSRTSARGVYAAGDCTGVFMLASVAAMQGRISMWHSLGDAVGP